MGDCEKVSNPEKASNTLLLHVGANRPLVACHVLRSETEHVARNTSTGGLVKTMCTTSMPENQSNAGAWSSFAVSSTSSLCLVGSALAWEN